jgi:NADPH:quinone reductase-like Zn-dependent oxidoreductase
MKAIIIRSFKGPHGLTFEDKPDPELRDGTVLIDVKASGVNFADLMMTQGLYRDAPPLPFTPGYEVAGTVEKVGRGVTDINPGDRVIAATYFQGYATKVAADATKTFPLPSRLSFSQGAAILVNYFTAWVALHEMARLKSGDTVLIHGAAGGVGIASMQLAKISGATIIGTAGSEEKRQFLLGYGASRAINYRTEDFVQACLDVTKGRGVDVILDPIGGDSISKDFTALAPNGRVVAFGIAQMVSGKTRSLFKVLTTYLKMRTINLIDLMNGNKGIFGLNALRLWNEVEMMSGAFRKISEFIDRDQLSPIIAKEFPLADAPHAMQFLLDRKNIGKVILTNTREA